MHAQSFALIDLNPKQFLPPSNSLWSQSPHPPADHLPALHGSLVSGGHPLSCKDIYWNLHMILKFSVHKCQCNECQALVKTFEIQTFTWPSSDHPLLTLTWPLHHPCLPLVRRIKKKKVLWMVGGSTTNTEKPHQSKQEMRDDTE